MFWDSSEISPTKDKEAVRDWCAASIWRQGLKRQIWGKTTVGFGKWVLCLIDKEGWEVTTTSLTQDWFGHRVTVRGKLQMRMKKRAEGWERKQQGGPAVWCLGQGMVRSDKADPESQNSSHRFLLSSRSLESLDSLAPTLARITPTSPSGSLWTQFSPSTSSDSHHELLQHNLYTWS